MQLGSCRYSGRGGEGPAKAPELLRYLAQYVEFRYVGELELGLEYLSDIGNMLESGSFNSNQFWAQIVWVARHMGLEASTIEGLHIPLPPPPAACT